MTSVLGIDAGGTATRALLVTLDGQVVAGGEAGPGNPIVGGRAAVRSFADALEQALRGTDPGTVRAGLIGIAGSGGLADPDVAAAYTAAWTGAGLRCPLWTSGDAPIAFAAGTPEPSGVVVIVGTGAVAALVEAREVARIADGLGWLLGDEGSGFWLGLQAVRRVARTCRATAVLPAEGLAGAVARHAGVATADELVRWATGLPLGRIAALAPSVCAEARAGDPVAAAITAEAVARLTATLDQLDAAALGTVVLAGGVLCQDTPVRDGLVAALQGRGVRVRFARDPARGAAWIAACRALGQVDTEAARRLHAVLCDSAPPSSPDPYRHGGRPGPEQGLTSF
ncbi:N-acetylglucosamine kinase [Streptacidiphilus sp. N1-12]|uniref:N-acetylglucosamine kinase n=2 Tax=Streptacidiphilus alkalitolerans TaxID=3342712 RepID=A0ABV6WHF8_9ACTN